MKATASALLSKLPGPVSEQWPEGERYARALAHGSMSVEFYAPIGSDPQTPHAQDELYFIHSGKGVLVIAGERHPCAPGDVFSFQRASSIDLIIFLQSFQFSMCQMAKPHHAEAECHLTICRNCPDCSLTLLAMPNAAFRRTPQKLRFCWAAEFQLWASGAISCH